NGISGVVPLPIGVTTAMTGEDPYRPGFAGFVVLGLSGSSYGDGYLLGDHTVPVVPDGAILLPLEFPAVFPGFLATPSTPGAPPSPAAAPNLPSLVGLTLAFSFLTLDAAAPFGVAEVSPPVSAPIVP